MAMPEKQTLPYKNRANTRNHLASAYSPNGKKAQPCDQRRITQNASLISNANPARTTARRKHRLTNEHSTERHRIEDHKTMKWKQLHRITTL